MEYLNEYKVVEGNKHDFEKELNQLTSDGWNIWMNVNTMPTREGMHYSVLVQKTTEKE